MGKSEPGADEDVERAAILKVIAAETDAYLRKDFAEWASYWARDTDAVRMYSLAGRGVFVQRGWDSVRAPMRYLMDRHPEPSPSLGLIDRLNLRLSIGADMAWVYYDQLGAETGDPFEMPHVHHEMKILRKIGGRWLLAAVVVLQQTRNFVDCPMIEVDRDGTVIWMNEKARAQLARDRTLIVSGRRLRARNRANLAALQSAIEAVHARQLERFGNAHTEQMRIPVALTEEEGTGTKVCWVGLNDNRVVVTFDDLRMVARRLHAAAGVFRLSEMQKRLSGLIVEGYDLAAAAEEMGVSVNTARTHLQRIFDKTGERSQSALVRALMSVAPPE